MRLRSSDAVYGLAASRLHRRDELPVDPLVLKLIVRRGGEAVITPMA